MSNSAFSNQPLLGTSGITAGTYNQLVVNSQGIVTAGANITGDLPVSQTAHGFSVGQLLNYNGSAYALALADNASDAEVVGIVATVIDANDFNLCVNGTINGLTGLTAGSVYYLSPTTAGALTATAPTTLGQISKPVLIATSGTSGIFYNWRGATLGTSANIAGSTLLGNPGTSTTLPSAITLGSGLLFTGSVLGLGNITPTSVTAAGTLSASNLSGTNTGDITLNGTTATSVTLGTGITFNSGTLAPNVPLTTYSNLFRNGGFQIAQRGTSGSISSGGTAYSLDGWILGATGATLNWQQVIVNIGSPFYDSMLLTGNTSMTDSFIKQRIEGYICRKLCNPVTGTAYNTTVQFYVYNNTGTVFTPTLTVKHPTVQDNYGTTVTDVNAVSLQSCPINAWTQLGYTFTPSASSYLGMEITLDFGAALNSSSKSIYIINADVKMTPNNPVGTTSLLSYPDIRPYPAELAFCQRYLPAFITTAAGAPISVGQTINNTAQAEFVLPFPVPARVSPTGGSVSGTFCVYGIGAAIQLSTSAQYVGASTIGGQILVNYTSGTSGGAQQGAACVLTQGTAAGTCLILFTGAEL